jgi:hypothetical protein
MSDLEAFESRLIDAVGSEDTAQMLALMDGTFSFAFWGSEGYESAPEEAVGQLQENYLSSDQAIDFAVEPPDLSDVLGPQNILSVWNPDHNPVDAIFSTGWGAEGHDEAFLIIIQKPDSSFAWDGLILASGSGGGFEGLYDQ